MGQPHTRSPNPGNRRISIGLLEFNEPFYIGAIVVLLLSAAILFVAVSGLLLARRVGQNTLEKEGELLGTVIGAVGCLVIPLFSPVFHLGLQVWDFMLIAAGTPGITWLSVRASQRWRGVYGTESIVAPGVATGVVLLMLFCILVWLSGFVGL